MSTISMGCFRHWSFCGFLFMFALPDIALGEDSKERVKPLISYQSFIPGFVMIPEGHVGIVEKSAKYDSTIQPGFHPMTPFITTGCYHVDMRENVQKMPKLSLITQDRQNLTISGVYTYQIVDPHSAVYHVGELEKAVQDLVTSHVMQTFSGYLTVEIIQKNHERELDKTVRQINRLTCSKIFREQPKPQESTLLTLDSDSEESSSEEEKFKLNWGVLINKIVISNIACAETLVHAKEERQTAQYHAETLRILAEQEAHAKATAEVIAARAHAQKIEIESEAYANAFKREAEIMEKYPKFAKDLPHTVQVQEESGFFNKLLGDGLKNTSDIFHKFQENYLNNSIM